MARYSNGILAPEAKYNMVSLEEELIELATDDLSSIQEDVAVLADTPDETEASMEGVGEGLDQMLNYLAQGPVLRVKHLVNGLSNLIKSTNEKIEKYESKLQMTQAEFNQKRQHFVEGDHVVHMNELWYFFRRRNGPTTNIIRDLGEDVRFSNYALGAFPVALLKEMSKLERLIGKAVNSDVSDEVAKVQTAADIFDNKYLGNEKYFDVVSVELKGNDVIETKSKLHRVDKVVANVISGSGAALDQRVVELSEQDIQKIIDFGFDYINAAKSYERVLADIAQHYSDLLKVARDVGRHDNAKNAAANVSLILTKASNYKRTLNDLCNRELIRSLKGARYCYYIALRAIYNATKYSK